MEGFKNNNRITEIDVCKALAVIAMVVCHGGVVLGVYHFIYLFHMPVFMIAAGCGFKWSHSDSFPTVLRFIGKKILSLWLPYFIWTTLFTFLNNVFLRINIYTALTDQSHLLTVSFLAKHKYLTFLQMLTKIGKGIWFRNLTELTGTLWFLQSLFLISCVYCLLTFLLRRFLKEKQVLIIHTVIALLLLALGFGLHFTQFSMSNIARSASGYILFHLGYLFVRFQSFFVKRKIWIYGISSVVSFGILLILNRFGTVMLVSNRYVNPFFLLCASVFGFGLVYSLSAILCHWKIREFFMIIGRRTLAILLLHMLAFKIIAAIVVRVYDLPAFYLAANPHLFGEIGAWWVAYTIVGIGIPVLLDVLYQRLIRNFKYRKFVKSIL
ncbi:MAG: acyltransferase family protein [Parasporobacterium sp.]|nr:acyltransferase family protein [Parasporobacterium sp.]